MTGESEQVGNAHCKCLCQCEGRRDSMSSLLPRLKRWEGFAWCHSCLQRLGRGHGPFCCLLGWVVTVLGWQTSIATSSRSAVVRRTVVVVNSQTDFYLFPKSFSSFSLWSQFCKVLSWPCVEILVEGEANQVPNYPESVSPQFRQTPATVNTSTELLLLLLLPVYFYSY